MNIVSFFLNSSQPNEVHGRKQLPKIFIHLKANAGQSGKMTLFILYSMTGFQSIHFPGVIPLKAGDLQSTQTPIDD